MFLGFAAPLPCKYLLLFDSIVSVVPNMETLVLTTKSPGIKLPPAHVLTAVILTVFAIEQCWWYWFVHAFPDLAENVQLYMLSNVVAAVDSSLAIFLYYQWKAGKGVTGAVNHPFVQTLLQRLQERWDHASPEEKEQMTQRAIDMADDLLARMLNNTDEDDLMGQVEMLPKAKKV